MSKSRHTDSIMVVVDETSDLPPFRTALTHHRLLIATSEAEALECCREEYEAGRRIQGAFFAPNLGEVSSARTIRRMLEIDRNILCTILTVPDQAIGDIEAVLTAPDSWGQLKRPFSSEEIRQKSSSMIATWRRRRRNSEHSHLLELTNRRLEEAVSARTTELNGTLSELTAANKRLQEEIAERKKTEDSLRLSQKLEAIGQLAAGVAHEINTPMQYISSNVYFLAEAYEDFRGILSRTEIADGDKELVAELMEEVPGALTGSLKGIEAISTIVNAMRGVARRDPVNKEPGDINAAIENTLALSRSEYRHCATIERELSDVPLVLCHVGEITQVLLNLIVNASHAIAKRFEPPSLGIIRVSSSADANWVTVVVEDNGCGVDAAHQNRVFDPFFTTKEAGRGTGQGLSIARRIVVDHGGTLTFTSVLGQGSTFRLRIPV